MEKKDKVKEVKNLNKKDDYGNSNFIVTFENGDSGFFRTKDENASQFKVGVETTYIFEEKPKRDGTGTYTKISLPKKDFASGGRGGGYQAMSIEDHVLREKVKAISISLSYAHDIIKDDATGEKVKLLAKTFYEWQVMMMDKLLKTEK